MNRKREDVMHAAIKELNGDLRRIGAQRNNILVAIKTLENLIGPINEQKEQKEPEKIKLSETPGIDITGGMDSVDYVRGIRDGSLDLNAPKEECPTVPKCDTCGDTGELRDAVQAWDIPGAPVPECPDCNGT